MFRRGCMQSGTRVLGSAGAGVRALLVQAGRLHMGGYCKLKFWGLRAREQGLCCYRQPACISVGTALQTGCCIWGTGVQGG